MKEMHTPIRECICCGEKLPKASLYRIVKNNEGVFYDDRGKQNGRGAYICGKSACLEKLLKQKRLNRAFKTNIDVESYQRVISAIETELKNKH